MNIHEFQAKEILRRYGAAVLNGGEARTSNEARSVAQSIGGDLWVVKAQIHAGGRGKAGGVKLARSLDEVEKIANEMIGTRLVTHQTGAAGKVVKRLYIESGANIQREFYLAIALDRALESPVFIASAEGGIEIEEIAQKTPERIAKIAIDPLIGFQSFHGRNLAFALGLNKEQSADFVRFASALYLCYTQNDANLVEINPLVLTSEGKFIALDAKMGFDDNALFRHTDIEALRDLDEEEASETEAAKYNLSYVKLDGDVGCMVNGAGLAMATMDIIKREGAFPANFLDVGGGASAETVAKGFEIILRDQSVKAIFVNIFGGIVRCDRVANGILEAAKRVGVKIPVVARLDGTNAELAKEILRGANMQNIIAADTFSEGAKLAVGASQKKAK
ncbi:MAG: ADP-forming succinate--CoA ligase subunit beta [Helicobacteraceae bacterium]|nr:ADP-forming succinate--CoA ligase subunit beta [Helicobacteraceae bacterium]